MLANLPSINYVWFVSAHAPFLMEPDTRRQYLVGAQGTRFYYVDVPELTQYGDRVDSVIGDLLRLGYRIVCSLPNAIPFLGTYEHERDGTVTFRPVTQQDIDDSEEYDLMPGESIREYAMGQHDATVLLTSPSALNEYMFEDSVMHRQFPRLTAYLDYESVCIDLAREDPYDDSLLVWEMLNQRWQPVDVSDEEYALLVLPQVVDAFPSEIPYSRAAPGLDVDTPVHDL